MDQLQLRNQHNKNIQAFPAHLILDNGAFYTEV